MKKIVLMILSLLVTLFISGCGAKLTPKQKEAINSEMFTQVSMWTEKGRIIGTNYATGMLIPINSKITILSINDEVIKFEYNKQVLRYEIYTKYTKVNSEQMLDRLFGKTKVDLSKLSIEI